ncbi:trigger factor [Miniphocaeibacter halophilus]|uniref:Trigger factor n=1 Tax=Miniphocaeibacter halophilus TaxID=2931922 RepID=A0AC61MQC2_9FIRM|nr:trigger factor [Miniphocaeibacter halophilus]QQK07837.1 trigger factor [Miniphocaeibacter halophilus]
MSAVLVNKEKNRAVFTVEVAQNKFEEAIQKAYIKNKKRFSIPGFRKGKVPRKIIELNYGEGIFYEDAINILLPEVYEEALNELDLDPVDNPEIDIDELNRENPVKIKFEVDVKPEPKLGDYSNLEAELESYEVKEEDIERVINSALESNSRLVSIEDREVKDKDIVNIDFAGKLDGELFPGGQAENYELTIGSNTFIPGFEEQIIGKKIGEEFEVNVTFPEDYQEETLKGKDVVFEVKLNSIQEKVLPELDDEFVKDVSEFDTLEEYRNNIKIDLEEQNESRKKIDKENKAIEALIDVMEVEIPDSMVKNEIEREYEDFLYRIQGMGLNAEQYFSITNTSEEDTKEELKPNAERKVKSDLAIEALIEAEGIEASDEEVDKELNELAEQYDSKNKDKFIKNMKKSGNLEIIAENVKKKKAVDKLVSMVNFKEESK